MYLLWLTLEYGISDWFATGTMYSFWKENDVQTKKRKFSGGDVCLQQMFLSHVVSYYLDVDILLRAVQ